MSFFLLNYGLDFSRNFVQNLVDFSLRNPGLGPMAGGLLVGAGMVVPIVDGVARLQGYVLPTPELFEEAFRDAVAADPNSAAAAFYLGYTVYKRAEPRTRLTPEKEEAKALFAKAFELDPGFRPVWAQSGDEDEEADVFHLYQKHFF